MIFVWILTCLRDTITMPYEKKRIRIIMMYSLNVKELLIIGKKNIKVILLFAIAVAVLLGGFKMLQLRNTAGNMDQSRLQNKVDAYSKWLKQSALFQESLEKEMLDAYDEFVENPIMKLDYKTCEYRVINFALDERAAFGRINIVKSWVNAIDCEELFGKKTKELEKYRNSLIQVSGEPGSITIFIYNMELYDYDVVAKKVEQEITKRLRDGNIKVASKSNVRVAGLAQELFDRQDEIRNNVGRVQSELFTAKNYAMADPMSGAQNQSSKRNIVLFVVLGGMIGVILGFALVIVRIIRRGTVISDAQVDACFGLERIGCVSVNNTEKIIIADSVVQAVTDDETIAILDYSDDERFRELAECMDNIATITYKHVSTLVQTAEDVEEYSYFEQIILPIELEATTQKDIQEMCKWARKFKKEILGYIVVSQR